MATTKIKALKGFSDGVNSMYVGEVRAVDSTLATSYITQGLAEAYTAPINPKGSKSITEKNVHTTPAE